MVLVISPSSFANLVVMVGQGELPLRWITLFPGLFIRLCHSVLSLADTVRVVPRVTPESSSSSEPALVLVEVVGWAPWYGSGL